QASTAANTYTLTATTFTRTGIALITYDMAGAVTLNGGSAANIYNIDTTAAGTSYAINGGAADDNFAISEAMLAGAVTLASGGGSDSFTISEAMLAGAVTVTSGGGSDTLTVNGVGPDNFTITATTIVRTGSATITYDSPNGTTVNIRALIVNGLGADT